MKSMSTTAYGGPEVIQEVHLPTPEPAAGEITIDVQYAAVGLIDAIIRRGTFADLDYVPKPSYVPGLEVTGTVRALGEGVTGLSIGEHVATVTLPNSGGYAEVVAAPAALVVSLEGSGADPVQVVVGLGNAATAYMALTELGNIRAGSRVLVHGVIGGLASAFPAVARMLGASRVVGTVRTRDKAEAAMSLGLDRVIVSDEFPDALHDEAFDLVIDPVGGEQRLTTLDVMAQHARMLVVGSAAQDGGTMVDTNRIWRSNIGILGFSAGLALSENPERGAAAGRTVLPLIASGQLTLPVSVLPLEEAAEAHAQMEARTVTGRLILAVSSHQTIGKY